MTASVTHGRALRHAGGSARGLLNHNPGHCPRIAADPGETVDRLGDPAIGMESEDGVIWVYGTAAGETLTLTAYAIENRVEMIAVERERQP
jgi:hypothetical protein